MTCDARLISTCINRTTGHDDGALTPGELGLRVYCRVRPMPYQAGHAVGTRVRPTVPTTWIEFSFSDTSRIGLVTCYYRPRITESGWLIGLSLLHRRRILSGLTNRGNRWGIRLHSCMPLKFNSSWLWSTGEYNHYKYKVRYMIYGLGQIILSVRQVSYHVMPLN